MFLQPLERFFVTPESIRHFRHYSRGLVSDLPRKTAEPLALAAGTPARNVQQFLKTSLWDHDGVTDAVQCRLRDAVADLGRDSVATVAILDKTSALKKGTKTPGVQRRFLGCVGKVDNVLRDPDYAQSSNWGHVEAAGGYTGPPRWTRERGDDGDDGWFARSSGRRSTVKRGGSPGS